MNYLSVIGLILNTIGSIFLAFTLNQTTKMLDSSITALEHFKDTLLSKGDVISFQGMDIQRKRALQSSKRLTSIGLILLIIGFILQLLALVICQK